MDLQLKLTNDGFAQRLGELSNPDSGAMAQQSFAFTSNRRHRHQTAAGV